MELIKQPQSKALTTQEKHELATLETTIERNLQSFYEIGMALMRIRDEGLYRGTYASFDDYCRERWRFQKSYAHRLIASAKVIENVSPIGDIPKTESQARPLSKLPPDKQAEAWDKAVQSAPEGKVTAKHVERAVSEMSMEDGTPESVKHLFKIDYPDSCAFNFSSVAIRQLERIPLDDPQRDAALDSVEEWIKKNR